MNDVEQQLIKEWRKEFNFSSLTPQAKFAFYKIVTDRKFQSISSRRVEELLFIGKSSVDRMRRGKLVVINPDIHQATSTSSVQDPGKKQGRPCKLTDGEKKYIINQAIKRRIKSLAVSIKWATRIANEKCNENGITVSQFLVSRLFKAHGWRRRKSMRK